MMRMRRAILLLVSVGLVVLFSSVAFSSSTPVVAQRSTAKPNIVFIIADDMRYDDLKYMPKTRKLLGAKGMRFKSAFVSNALCCPSRATIMRGQYSHNTGCGETLIAQMAVGTRL
jgi:N-acetylglucosamine-6-sulfatase